MLAAMDDRLSPARITRERAYADLYQEYAVDAAFLWLLRSIRIQQPHYTIEELATLEQRIEDQLHGLIISVDTSWPACEAALLLDEPGEVFTATVVAMHSGDILNIQKAVQVGLANPRNLPGLVSAFGWLPKSIAHPWIGKLLNGKDMQHKYLGVAACSIRRQDPGEFLTQIFQREDCRAHAALHARALRLAGELRRRDLLPALRVAASSDDGAIRFWALWSLVLLGERAATRELRSYVLQAGPQRTRAMQLAFRALPIPEAREWISALAQSPADAGAVITAVGVLGDPHAIDWLIGKMTDPKFARLAGESFTFITGVDLERQQLSKPAPPDFVAGPNDDPADVNVALDEDDGLPWPDAEKIAGHWRNTSACFTSGTRYFLGRPITADAQRSVLATGYLRQRHAAALELALLDPAVPLINTHAKLIP